MGKTMQYINENRYAYIVAGIGAAAGIVGTILFGANHLNDNFANSRRSHPGNIIRHLESGATFPSQNVAAEVMGISASNLSRHLHGKLGSVKGQHFVIVRKASLFMVFKKKIRKLAEFARKNPHFVVGVVGVIAGATVVTAYYESQTVLRFNREAQRNADKGAMIGYEVDGTQYILIKRTWH